MKRNLPRRSGEKRRRSPSHEDTENFPPKIRRQFDCFCFLRVSVVAFVL
ncbi:hypothetical protein HMPREF7215_0934 [Pyramidobacter piscolens W5455]|uniref:Uncharacterized protein n=1 Tax=Pyramidobacter piscolens W5455 TaxID=352165 RepID=A0ABP2HSW5_9BACT|nr:hypothetical protein HMPREF7215_0934 [Pyramidobacter piscolens W5455]